MRANAASRKQRIAEKAKILPVAKKRLFLSPRFGFFGFFSFFVFDGVFSTVFCAGASCSIFSTTSAYFSRSAAVRLSLFSAASVSSYFISADDCEAEICTPPSCSSVVSETEFSKEAFSAAALSTAPSSDLFSCVAASVACAAGTM